jgi:hypothetical protein
MARFLGCVRSFFCSEQILSDHTSLLSGAQDLCLLYDDMRVLDKTVSVAAWARGDSFRHDGVAPFANLIKLRLRGNFCRFRCSFGERHLLFSSDLVELDSDFWRLAAKISVRRSVFSGDGLDAHEPRSKSRSSVGLSLALNHSAFVLP